MPVAYAAIAEYLASLTAAQIAAAALVVAEVGYSAYAAQDAQRRAKNAYNDSLRDRTITARGAAEPRRMVLGRQRVGGVVAYIASTGVNKEHLVMVIALAAHECDGFEQIYFNDQPVLLDGEYVNNTGAAFVGQISGTTLTVSDASTSTIAVGATLSGPGVPDGITITAFQSGNGGNGDYTVSVAQTIGPITMRAIDPVSYAVTTQVSKSQDFTGDGSTVTFTLSEDPTGGALSATQTAGTGDSQNTDTIAVASNVGPVVTLVQPPDVGPFTIYYQTPVTTSYARVRTFLGGAGQTVDAVVNGYFPGAWDSSHPMSGCAGVVVVLDYNEDAFQTDVQVSAVMRGAKVYDPRLDSTAGGSGPQRVTDPATWTWSENPALLIGYAAMSPLCGRQPASAIRWSDIATAANVCDTPVDYATWGLLAAPDGTPLGDEHGTQLVI